MNAKYALALILALQVSMTLCELPTPSQELVDKYDGLKTTFFKRLMVAYSKLQSAVAPYVESTSNSEQGQAAKDFVEDLQSKPEFQNAVKILTGMANEASPLVDKARTTILGLYQEHLRPHIGDSLSTAIDNIKPFLDKVMPAE